MVYKIDLSFDPLRCLDSEYLYPDEDTVDAWSIEDSAGRDLRSYWLFRDRISDELISRLSWLMIVKNQGHIPDYGFAPGGGFAAVSEDVKRGIESLEPGVHQFIPLDAHDEGGRPLAKKFYYLNILQQLNAIDVERSTVGYTVHHTRSPKGGEPIAVRTMYFPQRAEVPARLMLRAEVTHGHHLWTGTRADLAAAVFISDELYERLSSTGISKLYVLRCEEF